MSSLPDYVSFKLFPGTPLEHIFSAAGDDLLELLQGLFTFNPSTRLTATQVCWCAVALCVFHKLLRFLHGCVTLQIICTPNGIPFPIQCTTFVFDQSPMGNSSLSSASLCVYSLLFLLALNPPPSTPCLQALKMRYFSNRPGPTPGHQLPRPNSSAEALKEKENLTIGIKRKRDGLETSK